MKTTLKYILSILIILLILSCKKSKGEELVVKEIENPIITDEFKIAFLNEILKDKSNEYIYNHALANPYIQYRPFEYKGNRRDVRLKKRMEKPSTLPEFINSYFKSKDTTFLINQIKNNSNFSTHKLKDFGYNNALDWKTIYCMGENLKRAYLISEDSLKRLHQDIEKNWAANLSLLLFNKELNMAHIHILFCFSRI